MLFDVPPPELAALSERGHRLPSDVLAPDVVALALACLLVGLLALAGALVAPGLLAQPALQWRVLGLGLLFSAVGAGLLARRRWARSAVLGMLAYGAVAQLTQGWLQDDVLAAWLEALSGQSPHSFAEVSAYSAGLGPVGSVLLCAVCGWYLLRLSLPLWWAQVRSARAARVAREVRAGGVSAAHRPHRPGSTSGHPPARNG